MGQRDRIDVAAARRRLAGRYPRASGTSAAARPGGAPGRPDWYVVEEVVRATPATPEELLAALTLLTALRSALDRTERQLVARAREQRVSWQRVAEASGLGSRQAAEQRWLRLRAALTAVPGGGLRQRKLDVVPEVARLRDRVVALHDQLAALPDELPAGPAELPPAGRTAATAVRLARRTLAAAARAPAGSLHDLAAWAAADLRAVPVAELGRAAAGALARLSAALDRPRPPESGRT